MKYTILRILIGAILLSLIAGMVVLIIGLVLGWKTSTQFSDGFFWAGAILILIGFVNIMAMYSQPPDSRLQHSQSAVHLEADEKFKIWEADLLRSRHLLAFLGISSLLLFGMSILVAKLF